MSGVSIGFPENARELGRQVREAALDHDAFSMPLKVCELASCRATCCHDGVFLDREQVAVIGGIVDAGRLDRYGIDLSGWRETVGGRVKTSTLEASAAELADGFPPHFPRTRCVFLDADHRCVLQRVAVDSEMHPWWWKPVSCWMHPLLFRRRADGRPVLGLARAGDDPAERAGYPGFGSCTPCGMPAEGGEPAWKVLRGELGLLGRIGGRDLIRELGGDDA